jgi:hypothetical protein
MKTHEIGAAARKRFGLLFGVYGFEWRRLQGLRAGGQVDMRNIDAKIDVLFIGAP